jgi:hypothetical protein
VFAAPTARVAAATRVYLGGQGRNLGAMQEPAETLAAHPDPRTCTLVGRALDSLGSPTRVRVLAAGSPDAVLADISADEVTSLHAALASCMTGGSPAAVNLLNQIVGTVGTRLSQLGFTR